jgi:hypothetical protein
MLKLNNRQIGPSGGFQYRQKESGMLFTGNSFLQLMNRVKEHRVANKYPIGVNIEAEIEDQCCQNTVTEEFCREVKGDGPAPRRHRIAEVLYFTKALAEKFLRGGKRVEQDQADGRAAVCAGCPDNVPVDGCNSCGRGVLEGAIRRVSDASTTAHDEKLKTCRWCGCFNAAQIWFPLDILHNNMSREIRESLPQFCWKK